MGSRGPKLGSTKKKRGRKSFVANVKQTMKDGNAKKFKALICSVDCNKLSSVQTELRFRRLEKAKKEEKEREEELEGEEQEEEIREEPDQELMLAHYGLSHQELLKKNEKKWCGLLPVVPLSSCLERKFQFSLHEHSNAATISMNKERTKAVLLTDASNVMDISSQLTNIQYNINNKAMKRANVPKYRTQSRKLFPLLPPPKWTTVEKIKMPFVEKIFMSPRFTNIVEILADGNHNVQRIKKVFQFLKGIRKENKSKSGFVDSVLFGTQKPNLISSYCYGSHIDVSKDVPLVLYSDEEIYDIIRSRRYEENPQLIGDENIILELLEKGDDEMIQPQPQPQVGPPNPKLVEQRRTTLAQFKSDWMCKYKFSLLRSF